MRLELFLGAKVAVRTYHLVEAVEPSAPADSTTIATISAVQGRTRKIVQWRFRTLF
jgi:hypothetical protein